MIAAGAAGVGAIGALGGGWIGGHFAVRASQVQALTARTIAEDEREQQRRREAYVVVQMYLLRWLKFVAWATSPSRGVNDSFEGPTDFGEEMVAVASLMATDRIRNLVGELNEKVGVLQGTYAALQAAAAINQAQLPAQRTNIQSYSEAVTAAARDVSAAADSVHEQMREELNPQQSPPAVVPATQQPRRLLRGRGDRTDQA